nr:MAG TPA: hypothetical protein [Caudoviricetes sp.]
MLFLSLRRVFVFSLKSCKSFPFIKFLEKNHNIY